MLSNTLKAHRKLTSAGADDKLAEALVEVLDDIGGQVATKEDLKATEVDLRKEIHALRTEMDHRFQLVDQRFESLEQLIIKKVKSDLTAQLAMEAATSAKRSYTIAITSKTLIVLAALGII